MPKNPSLRQIVEDLTDRRPFPPRLATLAGTFRANAREYRGKDYKELALRSQFLDPLLEELGWDPNNKAGSAYSAREVIQEASVTIEGHAKAPDYAFVTDSRRRFFLEAKRPSVRIATDSAPALQIRRYCWSAGLPFGLVTDFEEFAIYDCRAVPLEGDSSHVGRVAYFTLDEIEEYWPLLDGMFGRENVRAGMLELLGAEAAPPKGTRPIDVAFLDEIRDWRLRLANDVARRNPTLDSLAVANQVQRLIDRVVFLRIAEARGLESEGELQSVVATDEQGVYQRLLSVFQRADDRYNSGLFHLEGASAAELLASGVGLKVSDDQLRWVLRRLYYPEPYEFSVVPADILGRIYEQFLGEQIVVEEDRSVRVELKLEHRKSGGVYYTPAPIVDYIVQETLGRLLRGKEPADLKREGFAVVDPAAGSGSFLIAAYQFLLDWYRDQYALKPQLSRTFLETGLGNQVRVKTAERKRILTEHIFGVDIDPQAVEVTKLSLLLKVIEGQTQLEFDIGRILPDLDKNILCGNTILGEDFQKPLDITAEEELLYNPFSWEKGFPSVFKRGGFEAVIGNPPYLNVDSVWGKHDPRLAYLKSAYSEIHTDKTDLLFYFLRRAVDITKGEAAFIVSRSFLEADKAQKLRGWLAQKSRVRHILDFRHALVFPRVGINTAIVSLTRSTAVKSTVFSRFAHRALRAGYSASYLRQASNLAEVKIPALELSSASWNFGDEAVRKVFAKMDRVGSPVGDILHIGKGMETGNNKAFRYQGSSGEVRDLKDRGMLFERARNSDIQRYSIKRSGVEMLYVERVSSFEDLPARVRDHLEGHRDALEARAAFVRGNCAWWRYTWPLHREYFGRARIMSPYMASTNRFALDEGEFFGSTDTTVLYENGQAEDLRYILGLLNTRLLEARFKFIGKLRGGGVYEYYENTVSRLPIPRATPGNRDHDRIVALVQLIEDACLDRDSSIVASERAEAEARVAEAEAEIENIAGRLFGLTAAQVDVLIEALDQSE